jgi:hypothetical protein
MRSMIAEGSLGTEKCRVREHRNRKLGKVLENSDFRKSGMFLFKGRKIYYEENL